MKNKQIKKIVAKLKASLKATYSFGSLNFLIFNFVNFSPSISLSRIEDRGQSETTSRKLFIISFFSLACEKLLNFNGIFANKILEDISGIFFLSYNIFEYHEYLRPVCLLLLYFCFSQQKTFNGEQFTSIGRLKRYQHALLLLSFFSHPQKFVVYCLAQSVSCLS